MPYPFAMTTTESLRVRLVELEREIEVLEGERVRLVRELEKRLSVVGEMVGLTERWRGDEAVL